MDYIQIDKTTKEPLYIQIKNAIKIAIMNGTLKHMDRLPTEKEVCEVFDVSVIVIKNAYDELVKEGLIQRIKGKGTFVHTRKVYTVPLKNFYNFEYFSEFANFELKRRVILFDLIKPEPHTRALLSMSSSEPCYLVKVIIYLKMDPVTYQILHLPKRIFNHLSIDVFETETILSIFKKYGNLQPHTLKNVFKPHNLTSSEAQLLDAKLGSPAHYVRLLVQDEHQKTFAEVINVYPGETTKFEAFIK